MAEFTLQALHDEIEADPQGMDLKNPDGSWKGDQEIADLLNADTGPGAQTITRLAIKRGEIIHAIEVSECIQIADNPAPSGAFSETERWMLSMILRDEVVDATDEETFAALLAIFPTTAGFRNGTRANIQSTLQRTGSRAEVLWGEGQEITPSHVGHASNL